MSSYYVEARQQLYPQKGKKSAQKAKLSRSWSKSKVADSFVSFIDKYQHSLTYVWKIPILITPNDIPIIIDFWAQQIQSSNNPLDLAILTSQEVHLTIEAGKSKL